MFGEDAEGDDLKDSLIRGEGVEPGRRSTSPADSCSSPARVHIRIADFVYVAGSFAIEKGDPILVTPVGADAAGRGHACCASASANANVFVGMGVPDSDGDGDFDGSDVIGDTNGDGVYNPTGAAADIDGDGVLDEPDDLEAFGSVGVALTDCRSRSR